jgi:formylglycine-generating enzyme required for sulfatase activity
MFPNTLIKAGIGFLLGGPLIEILVEKAGDKAASIFKEKFTFTAFEIAATYQESYSYALAAISAGLADNKFQFFQSLTHSKVEREFAEQIEQYYLQPFVAQQNLSAAELRKQLIDNIKKLLDLPPIFNGENRYFTESELAAFLNDSGTLAITDLILVQLREVTELDDTLVAFFSYEDLLGKATLFFFRHLLHNDSRAKTTLETLQRECLLVKVDAIQSTQEQVLTRLQQQLEQQNATAISAIQAGNIAKVEQLTPALKRLQNAIDTVPQRLQAAVVAWQDSHQQFIDFYHRFDNWHYLLDAKVDQVLEAVGELGDIDETLKTLLQEFRAFKYELSNPKKRLAIEEVIEHLSSLLGKTEKKTGTVFRDSLKSGGEGPEMVIIPAGRFRMGDMNVTVTSFQGTGDELPVHEVSSFVMGRYPVTVGEFRRFVEATGYKTEAEKGDGAYAWKDGSWKKVKDANWRKPYFYQDDNHPVVCVSWNDAMAYIKWLSEQTGKEYRLPTEAEWEYAARAGTETYWWGNEIGKNRANCRGSGKSTSPVGSFKRNPFGLYDTVGNVWEWVADKWHENYEGAPIDGSVWEEGGIRRVLRGGSWYLEPGHARSAFRDWCISVEQYDDYGFRVASSVAWEPLNLAPRSGAGIHSHAERGSERK